MKLNHTYEGHKALGGEGPLLHSLLISELEGSGRVVKPPVNLPPDTQQTEAVKFHTESS